MKKIILIILLAPLFAQGQLPGSTLINSRYDWLGGHFKQLKIPAYPDTANYPTWLPAFAGDMMLDTSGGDAGTAYVRWGAPAYWRVFSGGTGGGGRFGVDGEDAIASQNRVFTGRENAFSMLIDSIKSFKVNSTFDGLDYGLSVGGSDAEASISSTNGETSDLAKVKVGAGVAQMKVNTDTHIDMTTIGEGTGSIQSFAKDSITAFVNGHRKMLISDDSINFYKPVDITGGLRLRTSNFINFPILRLWDQNGTAAWRFYYNASAKILYNIVEDPAIAYHWEVGTANAATTWIIWGVKRYLARVSDSLVFGLGKWAHTDPTFETPSNGYMYYNDSTQQFRGYRNAAWTNFVTSDGVNGKAVDSLWRTPGKDSIQFRVNGNYYAIKDSVGSGGGGGSGTVNSGTANQLAYYSSSGTAVSGLTAITANRALASDASGLPVASSTTATELGYVNGVTSAIQTQMDLKAPLASPTFTGTVTLPNATVTLGQMANMATGSLIYRKTAGSGAPEVNTLATLKTDLGLTGTNSGDQTVTINTINQTGTSTKGANGLVASGTAITPQTVGPTVPGMLSTGADTIAGAKVISGNWLMEKASPLLTLKGSGNPQIQLGATSSFVTIGVSFPNANDFYVQTAGNSSAPAIVAKQSNNCVGIGNKQLPTSTLDINGSFSSNYVTKTGNYTLTISDKTVDNTSGANTFTLPTAVGIQGREYDIINSSSSVLTMATTSSQTIEGVAASLQALSPGGHITVKSDNANWVATKPLTANGRYTPTVTAVTNTSSPTNISATFMRSQTLVFISGTFDVTDALTSTVSSVRISLPPGNTSNFTGFSDASGTVSIDQGGVISAVSGKITPDTTNDVLLLTWTPTSIASTHTVTFSGSFVIL